MERYTLPTKFWQIPYTASDTVTTAQLRQVLLETGGTLMACGELFNIKSKPLGAGVRKVYLTKTIL